MEQRDLGGEQGCGAGNLTPDWERDSLGGVPDQAGGFEVRRDEPWSGAGGAREHTDLGGRDRGLGEGDRGLTGGVGRDSRE